MSQSEAKIENKLKAQIEHLISNYENQELKDKLYDLSFEWYMKGVFTGLNNEIK